MTAPTAELATAGQRTKLAIHRDDYYAKTPNGRRLWFTWVGQQIGRTVTTNTALTKQEAHTLIELLEAQQ